MVDEIQNQILNRISSPDEFMDDIKKNKKKTDETSGEAKRKQLPKKFKEYYSVKTVGQFVRENLTDVINERLALNKNRQPKNIFRVTKTKVEKKKRKKNEKKRN